MPLDPNRVEAALTGQGQRDNYASAGNLAKRQALFAYVDPERSSGRPAIERLPWTGRERVLDAGCGNGTWMRTLLRTHGVRDVIGLDLSAGMLADARRTVGDGPPLLVGDVQRLPFRAASFDVVLCLWMLYHVPDIPTALSETRRVLRPGGRLLAATNSNVPRATDALLAEAIAEVRGDRPAGWPPRLSFSAENGAALLEPFFVRVDVEPVRAAFAFRDAQPVVAAMGSTRGPIEVAEGGQLDWPAVEHAARRRIDGVIARDGVFRSELEAAWFVAER